MKNNLRVQLEVCTEGIVVILSEAYGCQTRQKTLCRGLRLRCCMCFFGVFGFQLLEMNLLRRYHPGWNRATMMFGWLLARRSFMATCAAIKPFFLGCVQEKPSDIEKERRLFFRPWKAFRTSNIAPNVFCSKEVLRIAWTKHFCLRCHTIGSSRWRWWGGCAYLDTSF